MRKPKLSNFVNAITNKLGRTGLKIRKVSPDILVVAGIGGVIGATVMACRATKKLDDILDDHQEELNAIKTEHEVVSEAENDETVECPSDASEGSYRRSIARTYATTSIRVIRLYGPSMALYGISVACILKSHNILKQRNLAMAAAYEVLDNRFKKYREGVIDKYGEEADRDLRFGRRVKEFTEIHQDPETGEEIEETVVKEVYDIPEGASDYGFWFSKETCPNSFTGDPIYDLAKAKGILSVFSTLYNTRGHVLLHEVTDQFGIEQRTPQSIVCGWVKGYGDDYIDFGIDHGIFARDELGNAILIDPNDPEERGYMRNGFWIEPNVDGPIYDKI